MPIVENHSEHAFHLPPQSAVVPGGGQLDVKPVAYQEGVMFPRAGKINDDGNPEPSRTKVTAEAMKRMKDNPIMRSWFKPAAGRLQLAVSSDSEAGESMPVPNEDALGAPKKAQPRP